jgi:hypothetical protein
LCSTFKAIRKELLHINVIFMQKHSLSTTHYFIHIWIWLPAPLKVQRAPGGDAMHGDIQLSCQHSQRVTINTSDDAATKICNTRAPSALAKDVRGNDDYHISSTAACNISAQSVLGMTVADWIGQTHH